MRALLIATLLIPAALFGQHLKLEGRYIKIFRTMKVIKRIEVWHQNKAGEMMKKYEVRPGEKVEFVSPTNKVVSYNIGDRDTEKAAKLLMYLEKYNYSPKEGQIGEVEP